MNRPVITSLALVLAVLILHRLSSQPHDPSTHPSPASALPVATPAPSPAWFADRTAAVGIAFTHVQGRRQWYLPQVTGSGAALLDMDGDGELDVLLVQGSGPADGKSGPLPPCALYRQLDGSFREIGALAGAAGHVFGMAALAADLDNDGYPDLAITQYQGPTLLYRSNGDGTFTEAGARAGMGASLTWGSSLTPLDYDRDGFLDIHLGQYADFRPTDWVENPAVGVSESFRSLVTFMPARYPPLPNFLMHNQADGTFVDRAGQAGVLDPGGMTMGALSVDLDSDGWTDLVVGNDGRSPNQAYQNRGNGRFANISKPSFMGEQRAAMGFAVGDYDLDGAPDILITHFFNPIGLYHAVVRDRDGGRSISFIDRAHPQGLADVPSLVGWAVAFLDIDNDGHEDILELNGLPSCPASDPYSGVQESQPAYLFRNRGDGSFARHARGAPDDVVSRPRSGRGAAFGDLDRNGTIDVVLNNNNQPAELWSGRGTGNAWIGLLPVGTRSNRDGTGLRVFLSCGDLRRWKELTGGESYFSTNSHQLVFGLGTRPGPALARVRWPSGVVEEFRDLALRRYHRLVEGTGAPST